MAETFTDEDLTAYLDGEAGADTAARIDAARETDPTLVQQLDALDVNRSHVAGAMDALLDLAPAYQAPAANVTTRPWKTPAAIAAALVLGGFIGWSAPKQATDPSWTEAVASYQALYITETLTGSAGGPEQVAKLDVLGDRLGLPLSGAETLGQINFRRAQLLGFNGNPLVQIAYLSDEGEPVALCIVARPGEDAAPVSATMMGMASATWQRDGFGYLLIGTDDQALIDQIASQAQTLL